MDKIEGRKSSFFVCWVICCLQIFLTLKTPITTKVVCFSHLLKCLRRLYYKQCGPRSDCSCSGSKLFASILNSSVMIGNNLQQTTSADECSDAFFFLGALRVKINFFKKIPSVTQLECQTVWIQIWTDFLWV